MGYDRWVSKHGDETVRIGGVRRKPGMCPQRVGGRVVAALDRRSRERWRGTRVTDPAKPSGVGSVGGMPYVSEQVEEAPDPPGELYRVETYVEHVDPVVKTVYYMPGGELHEFFREYRLTDERVIDVRPVAPEDAEVELEDYRGDDQTGDR